jgi:hypothetical protein
MNTDCFGLLEADLSSLWRFLVYPVEFDSRTLIQEVSEWVRRRYLPLLRRQDILY